jgi:hypothetical protein
VTFLEMQTYALHRLSVSSSESGFVTQIKTILNQERFRLAARYRLKQTTADLAFVDDQQFVALPTDLTEILSIQRVDTTLQPVTMERFSQLVMDAAVVADGPIFYVRDGVANIRVYPVPQETDSTGAVVYYVQRPTALTADGDTPAEFPAEFHDLLPERAIAHVALSEEEPGLAQAASIRADQLEAQFREFMNRRGGVGDRRINLNVYGGRR